MRIVLDTNILLVSLSPQSQFFPIFKAFQDEHYSLCVSSEIMLEYEEILLQHVGETLSSLILQLIENAPNTIFVERYFQWNLMNVDSDDNKFVDCAIAGNAQYIVSHDKHFKVLKSVSFPKVSLLSATSFIELLGKE